MAKSYTPEKDYFTLDIGAQAGQDGGMSQNGKGKRPIIGYNHAAYRANFPFPERHTATFWCQELGVIPMGPLPEGRLTESEFRAALVEAGHVYKTEEPETHHD